MLEREVLNVAVSGAGPAAAASDVLVVPVWAGQPVTHLPAAARRLVRQRMRRFGFTGKWGSAELFPLAARGLRANFVGLVGLGSSRASAAWQAEGMRRGMGKIIQEAGRQRIARVAVVLGQCGEATISLAAAAADGAVLAAYRWDEYAARQQQDEWRRAVRRLLLLVDKRVVGKVRAAIQREMAVLSGVRLARDLVNRPASVVTPQALVEAARAVAHSPRVQLTVLDRQAAARDGWRAFLAVAQGSHHEPYVMHLTYTPLGSPAGRRPKIFLVGKGITFDSGGLSLKPADAMETMKIDMAGAATVLGVFRVLARLQPVVEVHGVVAACENMPSGGAFRPGDILTARNGKTIEVLNTDAEGRVTLADALSYAVSHKPDAVVDVATLTGACMVALGETHAGLWSSDDALAARLLASAEAVGEGLVRLPLPDEYRVMIESRVADVRNTATTKWGGAITAALFLREFAGDVPWAHLDIAGPSYAERDWLPYFEPGATGFGVRTLVEYLVRYAEPGPTPN